MADCVLPEEMILCILLRLPVKSILRFRSVCKPWNKLLSSPEFMQLHSQQFPGDMKSEDFIISGVNKSCDQISLFSTKCNGKKSRKLNFGGAFPQGIVGCCKGLLCMYHSRSGEIYLWNPALNLSKNIRLSGIDFGAVEHVSIGFGYDDNVGDFKVVRIVICEEGEDRKVVVEVYSAKSDSWKTIEVGFSFQLCSCKNDVIVNGNPCWITDVRNDVSRTEMVYERCVLWFDVKKLVFKIIPPTEAIMPACRMTVCFQSSFLSMDRKGSLAAIRYRFKNQRVESIYIWVFDEAEMIWRLKHAFRHIEMKMGNFMTCPDNGKFIGSIIDGKLTVFDFETSRVKVMEIDDFETSRVKVMEIDDDTWELVSQIHGYSESLAYIEGMEAVVVKKEEKTRMKRKRILRHKH